MNLKLVTWDGDLTQFLVEADTDEEAIKKAIEANFIFSDPEDDDDGLVRKDMQDKSWYEVEDVDFNLLSEIFRRTDHDTYGEGILVGSW